MIRSKGEAGTGDVSNAVTHMRTIRREIRRLGALEEDELYVAAKELQAPYDLVKEVAENGKLPVVLFTAGGIATPADAAMMMQLGAEGVFVGSGHLQVRQPRAARRGDRQGHDVPRRPRRRRQGLPRPRRGDGRHQRRGDPAAAPALRARLVTPASSSREQRPGDDPRGIAQAVGCRRRRAARRRAGRRSCPTSGSTIAIWPPRPIAENNVGCRVGHQLADVRRRPAGRLVHGVGRPAEQAVPVQPPQVAVRRVEVGGGPAGRLPGRTTVIRIRVPPTLPSLEVELGEPGQVEAGRSARRSRTLVERPLASRVIRVCVMPSGPNSRSAANSSVGDAGGPRSTAVEHLDGGVVVRPGRARRANCWPRPTAYAVRSSACVSWL